MNKGKYLEVMKKAAAYYASCGAAYFRSRGLSEKTIKQFGLGYSDGGLMQHIRREDAVSAGLAYREGEDIFLYRAIIPIRDESGNVVAFGGRSTGSWLPKYKNSPTTEFYKKSEILFGEDSADYSSGTMILCEGYMDCLTLRDKGIGNSVAVLGTALTEEHVAFLRGRGIGRLILLFDTDEPGRCAVERSLRSTEDFEVVIPSIAPYKDPDEALQKETPECFLKMISTGDDRDHFLAKRSASGLLDVLIKRSFS